MKRTFATAIAAVALAAAAPAYAADFILSDILPGGPTESNFRITYSDAVSVSADLGRNVGASTFLDRYFFAPTFFGTGSGSAITNLTANLNFGTPGLRIDGYALATAGAVGAALLDGFSTTNVANYNADLAVIQAFLAGSPVAAYSQVGTPNGLSRDLSSVPLDPNNFYVITIDGKGNAGNSIYSGNLSATSVPEPATWAMMLAGFGLIGFAMRRQRQSHPKVRFAF
jgi:hypothetical protein